jgi:hypothetical protein
VDLFLRFAAGNCAGRGLKRSRIPGTGMTAEATTVVMDEARNTGETLLAVPTCDHPLSHTGNHALLDHA